MLAAMLQKKILFTWVCSIGGIFSRCHDIICWCWYVKLLSCGMDVCCCCDRWISWTGSQWLFTFITTARWRCRRCYRSGPIHLKPSSIYLLLCLQLLIECMAWSIDLTILMTVSPQLLRLTKFTVIYCILHTARTTGLFFFQPFSMVTMIYARFSVTGQSRRISEGRLFIGSVPCALLVPNQVYQMMVVKHIKLCFK